MALRNLLLLAASTTAGGLLTLGCAQSAKAFVVMNGGFESSSIAGVVDSSFLNGTQNVTLDDWTVSTSYSFIASPFSVGSDLNLAANGPDPVYGTPITGLSGNPLGLYGNIPASPNGGSFVVSNGAYGTSAVFSQTVNGLDVSKQYVLSYSYAGGQQQGFNGDLTTWWKVLLGADSYDSPIMSVTSGGFVPWATYTSAPFTPAATSLLLRFEADGAPSGQQPMSLLDGVQIVEFGSPSPSPSPSSAVPGPVPVLGAGMTLAWARKLRRRITASAKPGATADA